jgi:hypothetical protein
MATPLRVFAFRGLGGLFTVDAEFGRGASFEAFGSDLPAAFYAEAIGAFPDSQKSFLDFPEIEALPISQTHFHALVDVFRRSVDFIEELIVVYVVIHAEGFAISQDFLALMLQHHL